MLNSAAAHEMPFFSFSTLARMSSLVPYKRPNPVENNPQAPPQCCPLCRRPFVTADHELNFAYFRSLRNAGLIEGGEQTQSDDSLDAPGYYEKYFVELSRLGRGSFGAVYVCRHVVEGNDLGLFAVKKLPIANDPNLLKQALGEVKLLEELRRHPNVVEYNHAWIDTAKIADFGPPVRCLFILMEYATEGSLDVFLLKNGKEISDTVVWYVFLSALCGVAHLHSKGILHRDLKPQNLLLTDNAPKPPRVMVADFGTSVFQSSQDLNLRTGGTGTVDFMAPELNLKDGDRYRHLPSQSSDVWSLGAILYYLAFACTVPVLGEDGNPRIPSTSARPGPMLDLIRAMMAVDPSKRPTCDTLLHLPQVRAILAAFEDGNWAKAESLSVDFGVSFQLSAHLHSHPNRKLLSAPPITPTTSRIVASPKPQDPSQSLPRLASTTLEARFRGSSGESPPQLRPSFWEKAVPIKWIAAMVIGLLSICVGFCRFRFQCDSVKSLD